MDLPDRDRDEEHPHDHGQGDDRPRPREAPRLVEPDQDLGEDVLDRGEDPADDHVFVLPRAEEREELLVTRVVDAAVAPRVAAQESPAGEHGAADEAELAKRVERVLRAARVVLARPARREEPEGPPPERGRARSLRTSRSPPARARPRPPRPATPSRAHSRAPPTRGERRGRSRAHAAPRRGARATTPAAAASRGCAEPRSRPSAEPRGRGVARLPRPPRAGTSAGRGTASKPTCRVGRRRRSRATATACGGDAPAAPSGRKALAPSRAAALQDRAARAGRHPRSKPVPSLAAADVRLVGAFHDSRVVAKRAGGARAASIATSSGSTFSTVTTARRTSEIAAQAIPQLPRERTRLPLSTPVETCVGTHKIPAKRRLFVHIERLRRGR